MICQKCGGAGEIPNPNWLTYWLEYGAERKKLQGDQSAQARAKLSYFRSKEPKGENGLPEPESLPCPACKGDPKTDIPVDTLMFLMNRINKMEENFERRIRQLEENQAIHPRTYVGSRGIGDL